VDGKTLNPLTVGFNELAADTSAINIAEPANKIKSIVSFLTRLKIDELFFIII
jgi:hypothetical protein